MNEYLKETYYLTIIDYKFIIHKEKSSLQVTQQNEGQISDLVAIFKAGDNGKYWSKFDDFSEKIQDVLYINPAFKQGVYAEKINNFLNNK